MVTGAVAVGPGPGGIVDGDTGADPLEGEAAFAGVFAVAVTFGSAGAVVGVVSGTAAVTAEVGTVEGATDGVVTVAGAAVVTAGVEMVGAAAT